MKKMNISELCSANRKPVSLMRSQALTVSMLQNVSIWQRKHSERWKCPVLCPKSLDIDFLQNSVHWSVGLTACLTIWLPVSLSACPSVCLPVCLSVCPPGRVSLSSTFRRWRSSCLIQSPFTITLEKFMRRQFFKRRPLHCSPHLYRCTVKINTEMIAPCHAGLAAVLFRVLLKLSLSKESS